MKSVPLIIGICVISFCLCYGQDKPKRTIEWNAFEEASGKQGYSIFNGAANLQSNDASIESSNFARISYAYTYRKVSDLRILNLIPSFSGRYHSNATTPWQGALSLSGDYSRYFNARRGLHLNINGFGRSINSEQFGPEIINFLTLNLGLGFGRLERIAAVYHAERILEGLSSLNLISDKSDKSIFDLAKLIQQLNYDFQRDGRRFQIYRTEQFFNYLNTQGMENFSNFQIASLFDLFNNEGNNLYHLSYYLPYPISGTNASILYPYYQTGSLLAHGLVGRIGLHNTYNSTLENSQYNPAIYSTIAFQRALNTKFHLSLGGEYYLFFNELNNRSFSSFGRFAYFVNSRMSLQTHLSYSRSNNSLFYSDQILGGLNLSFVVNFNTSINLSYSRTFRSTNLVNTIDNNFASINFNIAYYLF